MSSLRKIEHNIFTGGIKDFLKDLTEIQEQLKQSEEQIVEELTETTQNAIKMYAVLIDNSYAQKEKEKADLQGVVQDIIGGNMIDKISNSHSKIISTEQSVTYAEFGTGIRGQSNPYPVEDLRWDYDVNNWGEGGWTFHSKYGVGFVDTRGFPAFGTYNKAFEYVSREKGNIGTKILRKELGK